MLEVMLPTDMSTYVLTDVLEINLLILVDIVGRPASSTLLHVATLELQS
jgi:hypothetical protein